MVTLGCRLPLNLFEADIVCTGIDKSKERVELLSKGKSYVIDVRDEDIAQFVEKGILSVTDDTSVLSGLDTISICVPTPLTKTKDPDMSYITNVSQEVRKYMA